MKMRIIAGAIILGLGAVTLAVAQSGKETEAPRSLATPSGSSDAAQGDRADLRASVARLRAEVELLQLEHDLARERLSAGLKDRAGMEASPSRQTARDYMRIGAEVVGKGPEFEGAMQEKGDEIWKAVDRIIAAAPPADIDHLKRDFLRVATELNRKKIELVALEVHLDGSM